MRLRFVGKSEAGKEMKVIIVGAGIGGLTAALTLHAKGIKCAVYEQAPKIQELGIGINALPHCIKVLENLGLLADLDAKAIRTQELIYTNRFGQEIWREPRGLAAGYDTPQFSIHRGHLQTILLRAVIQRMGPVVHEGHKFVGFEQTDQGVTARFETAQGVVTAEAEALVGADGIHSALRKSLFPTGDAPLWNGVVMWRGAIDWPQYLTGGSVVISGSLDEKLVVYPIAPGKTEQTRLTNWSLNVRVGQPGAEPPLRQDWTRPGAREDLMKHLDRFTSPYLDIAGLLSATEQFWEWPMCDRDPLPYWSLGRVTLLGDAAHPMYPVGSNGAGQAILDAECLANSLAEAADIPAALKVYEQERLPLTAAVVVQNRSGGPEAVIEKVVALSPDGFDDVDTVLPYADRKKIVEEYATLAGFSQQQLNC